MHYNVSIGLPNQGTRSSGQTPFPICARSEIAIVWTQLRTFGLLTESLCVLMLEQLDLRELPILASCE